MIQINDSSFDTVFKRDAMMDNRKYAGGVIYAHNYKDALKIAKQLVKDIQNRINTEEDREFLKEVKAKEDKYANH